MIAISQQKALSSYLLTCDDVPPWLRFGKQRFVFLSRDYLCHLATGGKCYDIEDLILVEMLLTAWEAQEKGVTP